MKENEGEAKPRRPATAPSRLVRIWFAVLVLAVSCLSLAYVFLTPAGEGFDELAHYSYISQLATKGQIPNQLKNTMDLGWQLRHKGYPVPYSSTLPFNRVDGLTYQQFFTQSKAARAKGLLPWYSTPGPGDSTYRRGAELNAAGQHPPLYYATMAPFFLLSRGWSYGDRAILLRFISVIIAMASFVFLWLTIRDAETERRRYWLLAGTMLMVTPAFYYDIARLGNDSLCLLLGAAAVWLMLRLHDRGPSPGLVVWLGVVLGLGSLTKLFFVPLAAGVVICLALFGYRRYGWKKVLLACLAIVLIVAAISGWWYVRNQVLYGNLTGAQDFIVQKNVPSLPISVGTFVKEFGRSIVHFWQTFIYSSTWSFMAIPKWAYLPYLLLWLIAAVGVVLVLVKGSRRQRRLVLCSLIILLLLSTGFASHAALWIFKTGKGGVTNGYYLYFVWMIVFGLLALGLLRVRRRKAWWAACLGALLAVMWFVCRLADWIMLMTYSGLGGKGAHGALTGAGAPFTHVGTGLGRLNQLMPVAPGAVLWVVAVLAQLAAIGLLVYFLVRAGGAPEDKPDGAPTVNQ